MDPTTYGHLTFIEAYDMFKIPEKEMFLKKMWTAHERRTGRTVDEPTKASDIQSTGERFSL